MTVVRVKETKRRMCKEGLLESYLRATIHQESPVDFHTWTCISLIAAALGRQCFCNMGMWEIYPNLYIILIGESAITHKSTAIKMGMRPFRKALPEVNLLAQKMSPEALINALANISKAPDGEGRSEAYIESSELSNLLGQSRLDDTFLKLLTEMWDSPDYFSYATLGRGVEKLTDVCLNLLGGSTPSWLRNSVPETALEGGFFSRLILVQRPPKGEKNPRPMLTTEQRECIITVQNDLQCIRENMRGEFHVEDRAQQFFDEWYHEHNHPEKANSFMRGYYGRKGDFMLKVAMCLSAAFNDDMRVTVDDMELAHRLLNENERFTENLVRYMGATEKGAMNMKVLAAIKRNMTQIPNGRGSTAGEIEMRTCRGIDHSRLQRNLAHQIRKDELQLTLDTLIESGDVILHFKGPRQARVYEYVADTEKDLLQ